MNRFERQPFRERVMRTVRDTMKDALSLRKPEEVVVMDMFDGDVTIDEQAILTTQPTRSLLAQIPFQRVHEVEGVSTADARGILLSNPGVIKVWTNDQPELWVTFRGTGTRIVQPPGVPTKTIVTEAGPMQFYLPYEDTPHIQFNSRGGIRSLLPPGENLLKPSAKRISE